MADPVLSNLLSAVIGGLAGGIGTFIAALTLYKRRRNHDRGNLRLALLSELNSMQLSVGLISRKTMKTPDLSRVSTAVYDGNTGSVGLLTPKEAKAVVEFYSWLDEVIPLNQKVVEGDISSDKVRESVHTNHIALKDNWVDAKEAIAENLSEARLQEAGFEDPEITGVEAISDEEIEDEFLEEFGLRNEENQGD